MKGASGEAPVSLTARSGRGSHSRLVYGSRAGGSSGTKFGGRMIRARKTYGRAWGKPSLAVRIVFGMLDGADNLMWGDSIVNLSRLRVIKTPLGGSAIGAIVDGPGIARRVVYITHVRELDGLYIYDDNSHAFGEQGVRLCDMKETPSFMEAVGKLHSLGFGIGGLATPSSE